MRVWNLEQDYLYGRGTYTPEGYTLNLGDPVQADVRTKVRLKVGELDPDSVTTTHYGLEQIDGIPVLTPQDEDDHERLIFTGVWDWTEDEHLLATLFLCTPMEVDLSGRVLAAGKLAYSGEKENGINALIRVEPDWLYTFDKVHFFSCATGELLDIPFLGDCAFRTAQDFLS